MLVSFSASNFRSVGEEQTLTLIASKKIADHSGHLVSIASTNESVVRAAVMYGANAAGKSNLVRAMKFAQLMVSEGHQHAFSAVPVAPFRFDSALRAQPSSFEFRFLAQEMVFTYGFDIEGRDIRAEWLTVFDGQTDRVIFERGADGHMKPGSEVSSLFSGDQQIKDLLTALEFLPLTSTQLLLNRVSTLPHEALGSTFKAVLHWLTESLLILSPDHRSPDLLDRLYEDVEFRHLAEQFLEAVGTGVGGLGFEAEEFEMDTSRIRPSATRNLRRLSDIKPKTDDPARAIRRQLLSIHPSSDKPASMPFAEESDGTIQLLHLMPVLASVPTGTKVVVIDELDRSLHPLLCWEFIRLFSETAAGSHKQLIVTTHEAHLLNQDLLRRDEYWFVEKDSRQQTQLASLSDFKVRNDLKIEKGYLQGRFGAIPFIGSMADIEKLLDESGTDGTDQEIPCPDDRDR